MSLDKVFALYIFCADYHEGQWTRLYSLMSRITRQYRPYIPDSAWHAINRGGRKHDRNGEWETARTYYRELKRAHLAGKHHK